MVAPINTYQNNVSRQILHDNTRGRKAPSQKLTKNKRPVRPRDLARSKQWVLPMVQPNNLYTPFMDMCGENTFVLDSLNGSDYIKILNRYNKGELAISRPISVEDLDQTGYFMNMTEPCELDKETKRNGDSLMLSLRILARREKLSLKDWVLKQCKSTGSCCSVGRLDNYIVNVTQPMLAYRCACCQEVTVVDGLQANSTESNEWYNNLPDCLSAEDKKEILKNRGLDINYMIPRYCKGATSLHKLAGLHNTDINNNETGDTWNCAWCGNDLRFQLIVSPPAIYLNSCYVDIPINGTELDKLMVMKYGDFYDDMDRNKRLELEKSDLNKVRKYFRNYFDSEIQLPSNCGVIDMGELQSLYPAINPRNSKSVPSLNPKLSSEIMAAMAKIRTALPKGEMLEFMNGSHTIPDASIKYSQMSDWIMPCNPDKVKAKPKQTVVLEFGCTLQKLMSLLSSQTVVFAIEIKPSNNVLILNDSIYVLGTSSGKPMTPKWYDIITSDYIQFRKETIQNKIWFEGDCVNIRCFQYVNNIQNQLIQNDDLIEVKVSLPDNLSVFGDWTLLNMSSETIKLSPKLFRAIAIRGMSGEVSTSNLATVAEFFMRQIRNNRGLVIHNRDIEFKDVWMHVILAQAYIMSLNRMSFESFNMFKIFNKLGPLRSLIPITDVRPKEFILYLLSLLLGEKFDHSQITEQVVDFLKSMNFQNYRLIWSQLLSKELYFQTRKPKILTSNEKNNQAPYNICPHHKSNCLHELYGDSNCACCGLPCASTSSKCNCCSKNSPVEINPNWERVDIKINRTKQNRDTGLQSILNMNKTNIVIDNTKNEGNKDMDVVATEKEKDGTNTRAHKQNTYASMVSLDLDLKQKLLSPLSAIKCGLSSTNNLPLGMYTLTNSWIDIIDAKSKVDDTEECVYNCLNEIDARITKEQFKAIIGKVGPINFEEMTQVINTLGKNAVIVTTDDVTIIKNVPDLDAITVAIIENEDGTKHCVLASMASNSPPPILCYIDEPYSIGDLQDNFDLDTDQLSVNFSNLDDYIDKCIHVHSLMTNKPESGLGKIINLSNFKYWTYPSWAKGNNSTLPSIRVEVNDHYDLIQKLINGERCAEMIRNDLEDLPLNLHKDVSQKIKTQINLLDRIRNSHIRAEETSNLTKFKSTKITKANIGYWTNIDDNTNCKTLDFVYLRHFGNNRKRITIGIIKKINYQQKRILVDTLGEQVPMSGDISFNKISAGSVIRKIQGLLQLSCDRNKVIDVLKNCKLIYGVPGAGKTTSIEQNLGLTNLVIASTSGAVKRSKELFNDAINIISVEKFLSNDIIINKPEMLILDEAKLVDWTVIGKMIDVGFKQLIVLGDVAQIGMRDMTKDVGYINMSNNMLSLAIKYSNNQTKLTKSWRIPNQLVPWLRITGMEIELNDKSTISWEPTWLNVNSIEAAANIIKSSSTDLVLTPYKYVLHKIQSLGVINASTVHANAGQEVNHCTVVLCEDVTGVWSLNGDAEFLNVALTRGRTGLTVIVVGRDTVTSLDMAITDYITGKRKNIFKSIMKTVRKSKRIEEIIELLPSNDREIVDKGSKSAEKERINVEWLLNQMSIIQTNDDCQHFFEKVFNAMTTDKLDLTKGKFSLIFNKNNATVHLTTPTALKFKVTINKKMIVTVQPYLPLPHSLLLNNLKAVVQSWGSTLVMSDQLDIQLAIKSEKTLLHKHDYTVSLESKRMLLAWMCDMSGRNQIIIDSDLGELTISRTEGCVLRCNVRLELGESIIILDKCNRMLSQNETDDHTLLLWLYGKLNLNDQFEWPNKYLVILLIYVDRLFTKDQDIPKQIQFHDQVKLNINMGDKCHSRHKYVLSSNQAGQVTAILNTSTETKTMLIKRVNNAWLLSIIYEDLCNLSRLFALNHCRGSDGMVLEGLSIPITQHFKHNTTVAKEIQKQYTKEKIKNAAKTHDILWIPRCNDTIKNELKNQLPRQEINILRNATTRYSHLTVIESVLLNAVCSTQLKTNCVFAGADRTILANNNKHYVKVANLEESSIFDIQMITSVIAHGLFKDYYNIVDRNTSYSSIEQITVDLNLVSDSIIVFGINLTELSLMDLRRYLNKRNKIYGIIPSRHQSGCYDVSGSDLWFKGLDNKITMNEELIASHKLGIPNSCDVAVETMFSLNDLSFVTVRTRIQQVKLITHSLVSKNKIMVKFPIINNNIVDLLNGKPIIMIKELSLDTKMYRSVMLRTLSIEGNKAKISAHIRSIASTEVTSEHYIGLDKDISVEEAMWTVQLALLHQNNVFVKYKWLIKMLDGAKGDNIKEAFISQFLSLMSNFFNVTVELKEIISKMTVDTWKKLVSESVINQLYEDQKKLMIFIDKPDYSFVEWGNNEPIKIDMYKDKYNDEFRKSESIDSQSTDSAQLHEEVENMTAIENDQVGDRIKIDSSECEDDDSFYSAKDGDSSSDENYEEQLELTEAEISEMKEKLILPELDMTKGDNLLIMNTINLTQLDYAVLNKQNNVTVIKNSLQDILTRIIPPGYIKRLTIFSDYLPLLTNLKIEELKVIVNNPKVIAMIKNKTNQFTFNALIMSGFKNVESLVIKELKREFEQNYCDVEHIILEYNINSLYLGPMSNLINKNIKGLLNITYNKRNTTKIVIDDMTYLSSSELRIKLAEESDKGKDFQIVLTVDSNADLLGNIKTIKESELELNNSDTLITNDFDLILQTAINSNCSISTTLQWLQIDDRLKIKMANKQITTLNNFKDLKIKQENVAENTLQRTCSTELWNLHAGDALFKRYNTDTINIIYNPKTLTGCVQNCLTKLNVEQNLIDKLSAEPTEEELIAWVNNNQLNIGVIRINNKMQPISDLMTFNNVNNPTGLLGLVQLTDHNHCVIINKFKNRGPTLKITNQIKEFITAKEIIENSDKIIKTTQMENDISSKALMRRLQADIMKSTLIVPETLMDGDNVILSTLSSNLKESVTLMWVLSAEEAQLHLTSWYTDAERSYTTITSNLLDIVAYILPTKMIKQSVRIEQFKGLNKMTWNNSDVAELKKKGIMCKAYKPNSAGQLILYNYDNRSHHNRKILQENTLSKLTISIYDGELKPFDITQLISTSNKALNREILKKGKHAIICECVDVFTAKLLAKLTNNDSQMNEVLGNILNLEQWESFSIIKNSVNVELIKHENTTKQPNINQCSDILKNQIMNKDWTDTKPEALDLNTIILGLTPIILVNEGAFITKHKGKFYCVDSQANFYTENEKIGQTKYYPLTSKSKASDWWGIIGKISQDNPNLFNSMENVDVEFMSAVNGPNESSWMSNVLLEGVLEIKHTGITESDNSELEWPIEGLGDNYDATLSDYDFWKINDLTEVAIKYGPNTDGKLKSRETSDRTFSLIKHSMVPIPAKSRPVATKMIYKEHNTITGRLMSVKHLRQITPPLNQTLNNISKAFFHKDSADLCSVFINDKITYNTQKTLDWISKHHRAKTVLKDLTDFLKMGSLETAINDINIHLKLESLLKKKVIKNYLEQQPRSIMWQNYFVAAIFSPIFMEVKKRLKLLLHGKFIYADGMTPAEINETIKTMRPSNYMFENDLEKQDRQTDKPLTDLELSLYHAVGCHDDVLYLWQTVHEIWRFKSNYSWGFCREMRLTGQATTSLGNWITDMQTHAEFIQENFDSLDYIMMTGDDNNAGFQTKPDISSLQTNIATKYNMMSEPMVSNNVATFCCFFTINYDGVNQLVPDIVRMRNRYEVTNGVSETTEANMKLRSLSYLMMTAVNSRQEELIEKNSCVNYSRWFSVQAAVKACSIYYSVPISTVLNDLELLNEMLQSDTIHEHKWEVWKPTKS